MFYVYILKSLKDRSRSYIGFTTDIEQRLKVHNLEENIYSKRYSPWAVETYVAFKDKSSALRFEKYLKVGSGQAFLKKRLLPVKIFS